MQPLSSQQCHPCPADHCHAASSAEQSVPLTGQTAIRGGVIHNYDGPSPAGDDYVDVLGVLWILTTFLSDEDGQRIDENIHKAYSLGEEAQIVKHYKAAKLHIAWMLAKVLTNGPKLFRLTPEMTDEVRTGLDQRRARKCYSRAKRP